MRLKGTTILLSGDFANRAELEAKLRERGAQIVDRVSPAVEYVFEGSGAGGEVDTAREMGVRVRGEADLKTALASDEIAEKPLPPSTMLVSEEPPPAYLFDEPPPFEDEPRRSGGAGRKAPAKREAPVDDSGERVFDKGARVRITGGREGVGMIGEIFWWGESKYGNGMRAGVEVTRDQKFWVDEEHLGWPDETEDIKPPEGPVMGRGTRVRVISGKNQGVEGDIFWWGESRYGDGMRAGIEDAGGDKLFIDAEHLEVVEDTKAEPQVDEDIPF